MGFISTLHCCRNLEIPSVLEFELHQNSENFRTFSRIEQGHRKFLHGGFSPQISQTNLSFLLDCLCTNDAFHTTNSERCFWLSVSLIPVPSRWYEPFGESLSRLTVDSKTTSEFTVFNLVIRLSNVNCWPFFRSHLSLSLSMCCNSLPLYWASPFSSFTMVCVAGSHDNISFFQWCSRDRQHVWYAYMIRRQDILAGMVFLSFLVVGEVEMCT